MIILEENFKWHLEAFASELFISWLLHNAIKQSPKPLLARGSVRKKLQIILHTHAQSW